MDNLTPPPQIQYPHNESLHQNGSVCRENDLYVRSLSRVLLLALLLLAFALRIYALERYPTGASPDEAGDVIDILNIAHSGHFPIYEDFAVPEPLHRILYAALSLIVGNSVGSIRFLGACVGVLTAALVAWIARLAARSIQSHSSQLQEHDNLLIFETFVTIAAVAMLALSLSHIVISRAIYRAILQPVFTLFFLGYLLRGFSIGGFSKRNWANFAMSGVSLALTLYSYTAGFVVPAVLGLLGLQLLFTRIRSWRQWLPALVLLGLIFLVCIAPILYTLFTEPQFVVGRASELNRGQNSAFGWGEIRRMAGQFLIAGDVNPQYNIANAPLVAQIWQPFLILGLAVLVIRIRQPVSVLLGGLLALATVPVLLAGEIPHGLRIMGVFAVLPILVGVGVGQAMLFLWRRSSSKRISVQSRLTLLLFLTVALIAIQAYQSAITYFSFWDKAAKEQTTFIFNRHLPIGEWYFRPDRHDLARWISAQSAPLLLPLEEIAQQTTHGWLAADFPTVSALDEPISLARGTTLVIPWSLESGDLRRTTRHFVLLQNRTIYLLPPFSLDTHEAMVREIDSAQAITHSGTLDLMARIRLLDPKLTVTFEPALTANGAEQFLARFQPGLNIHALRGPLTIAESTRQLIYTIEWQPLRPPGHFYSSFLQLQTQAGERLAGDDVYMGRWLLAAPYWQPYQTMPDVHHLALPGDLPPGAYKLVAGLYLSLNQWLPVVNKDGVSEGGSALIAWVKRPMPTPLPLPANAKTIAANLDDALVLQRAFAKRTSASILELSLEWRSLVERPEFDATLFLHLMDDSGNIVFQQDARPFDGQYPTFIWGKDERIVTVHRLEIANLDDELQLFVGMYTFPDLKRLAVKQNGLLIPDGRIELGRIAELISITSSPPTSSSSHTSDAW